MMNQPVQRPALMRLAPVKAPAAVQEETWEAIGDASVTENFTFNGEQTYDCPIFASTTTEGLYKLTNLYGGDDIIIHAENPNQVYILPTLLKSYSASDLLIMSYAGYYYNYGVSYADMIEAHGSEDGLFGQQVKNVITIAENVMLYKYNNNVSYGKQLTIVLPDREAPVITAATESYVGSISVVFAITTTDDVDEVDDLTFTVMNGEDVHIASAKTVNGALTISGLQMNTEYHMTLLATDRAGHTSESFALHFTTVAQGDEQAPELTVAEVNAFTDKQVTLKVGATDDMTAPEEMVFIVTFEGQSPLYLTADADSLIIIKGLTPSTVYNLTVVAQDKAGNISTATPLNFTTLDIIPVLMDIHTIRARYYPNYSSENRYDYYMNFKDTVNNNTVVLDVYTPLLKAISGTYSTVDERIGLDDSQIAYGGSNIQVQSASLSMEFVSLDYSTKQATYTVSFEVMGKDGNLYKATKENIEILTYYVVGDNSYYQSMKDEVTDVTAPVITAVEQGVTTNSSVELLVSVTDDLSESGDLLFTVKNGEDILLEGVKSSALVIEDLTIGTTYNLTITATDEADNTCEPFVFSVTTSSDTEAPVLVSVALLDVSQREATIKVNATDNIDAISDLVFIVTPENESARELTVDADSVLTLTGLTPSTAYSLIIATRDKTGNLSAASEPIVFTTLDLVPIGLDITWVQAQYYSSLNTADRYCFLISFWNTEVSPQDNVRICIYSANPNALSGTYTQSDYVNLSYSVVVMSGVTIQMNSVTLSLEFISLNKSTGLATYLASYEAIGEDGNLYKGSTTMEILSYYNDNEGTHYQTMLKEDTEAPVLSQAKLIGTTTTEAVFKVDASDNIWTLQELLLVVIHQDNSNVYLYADEDSLITITGLTPATEYEVELVAVDRTDNFSEVLLLSFTTQADIPSGIEDTKSEGLKDEWMKILRNGQLYLRYKGTMYNVQGQEIK